MSDLINSSGCFVVSERAVDEIDADDAERFLFADIFVIEQADMDDDLRRLAVIIGLETDAEPPVAFDIARETVRGDGVRKHEERATIPARGVQTLEQQIEFVIEHRREATLG